MLLLKELHHDNIVSLLGAGFLPDGRRFVALVSLFPLLGCYEYCCAASFFFFPRPVPTVEFRYTGTTRLNRWSVFLFLPHS